MASKVIEPFKMGKYAREGAQTSQKIVLIMSLSDQIVLWPLRAGECLHRSKKPLGAK